MPEPKSDPELLRLFAGGDSAAFAELVRRHSALVYSAALRQTGPTDLAEDVTQATFILLSMKAARLGPGVVLSAWLYRAARYAARDAMKKQRRRKFHESQAAHSPDAADRETGDVWPEVSPMLDDAMYSLKEKDRMAVLLRFFEGQTVREVGARLGISESAAAQRVSRAIERLRRFFASRGVHVPTVGLGAALMNGAVIPAPARVTDAAVLAASTPNPTLVSIAKGTSKMMFWTPAKIIAAAATIALGTVALPTAMLLSGSRLDGHPAPQAAPVKTAPLFSGSLPEGGQLQVCLSDPEGDPKRLWNPDGSVVDPVPFQFVPKKLDKPLKPGQRRVAVLIRAVDPQGQKTATGFSAGGNIQAFGLGGATVEKDNKAMDDWQVEIVTLDNRQRGFEVDIGLTLGQWHKLATWGTNGQTGKMLTSDRAYVAEAGIPAERDGELIVPLALQLPRASWTQRLFAVLKNGKREKDSTQLGMRLINGVGITSFVFWRERGIKADDVASYELEVLPQPQLAMKNLPTAPGGDRPAEIQVIPAHALPEFTK